MKRKDFIKSLLLIPVLPKVFSEMKTPEKVYKVFNSQGSRIEVTPNGNLRLSWIPGFEPKENYKENYELIFPNGETVIINPELKIN